MSKKKKAAEEFRTNIGGQALIEGILMRGPSKQSIVVRTQDGLVTKESEPHFIREKYKILGWPFLRGIIIFIESMVYGVKALTYSASFMPEEEQEQPTKFDKWVEEKLGSEKAEKALIGFAVFLGVCLSVGLFVLLPTLLAGFMTNLTDSSILRNLTEGALRLIIFFLYMYFCTKSPDLKRVFRYHGAEHKSIFCYERGLPLTVENVREQSRFHPRCGTSFLFIVMIISIFVFSFLSWNNVFLRMALRILLLPVVMGISYEIIHWAGKHDNWLSSALSAPGKALQRLTTAEPDDGMMECAIEALKLVIPEKKGQDEW
ncbi:MAG: DUF1385 domain-containing protein [Firmicutes bacterium HGW-Firmicutes-16]|nr:MAG: DUF1385 domain-containing protein [Firmicutes bacterium HGW-Firmicutes-16]